MPQSSQGYWDESTLRRAFGKAEQADWWHAIREGATAYKIAVERVIALGYRETRLENVIGDSGHGFGPLQIDRRFHPVLFDGASIYTATGAELVLEGCRIFSEYRKIVQAVPEFATYSPDQFDKITASAYNCGTRNAILGAKAGDSDLHTTGRDYGRHVMAMAPVFLKIIGGKS